MLSTPPDDPESFVRRAAQAMVDELGKRPDFIKLMLIEMVEFNGRNMPSIIETILPEVLPLIQNFTRQKGLLRDIPPFIFFRAFLGLFFSYYMTELILANTPAAMMSTDALDNFVDIFLHGVMTIPVPARDGK
jgi:hypothetical protein